MRLSPYVVYLAVLLTGCGGSTADSGTDKQLAADALADSPAPAVDPVPATTLTRWSLTALEQRVARSQPAALALDKPRVRGLDNPTSVDWGEYWWSAAIADGGLKLIAVNETAGAQSVAQIPLAPAFAEVESLHLTEAATELLVVGKQTAYSASATAPGKASPYIDTNPLTRLRWFAVQDRPEHSYTVADFALEGRLLGSVRNGRHLYVVTHFLPWLQLTWSWQSADSAEQAAMLTTASPYDYLPEVREAGASQGLMVRDCLAPGEGVQLGAMINITHVDMRAAQVVGNTCLRADVASIELGERAATLITASGESYLWRADKPNEIR